MNETKPTKGHGMSNEKKALKIIPRQYRGITENYCIQCRTPGGTVGDFFYTKAIGGGVFEPATGTHVFRDLVKMWQWVNIICRDAYHAWFNDYATLEKWAEHNGLDTDFAEMIIRRGREIDRCEEVSEFKVK